MIVSEIFRKGKIITFIKLKNEIDNFSVIKHQKKKTMHLPIYLGLGSKAWCEFPRRCGRPLSRVSGVLGQ